MIVSIEQRIKELAPRIKVDYDTGEFHYSFSNGRERLAIKSDATHGWYTLEGVYHPNVTCEGEEVCKWCGRTL